MRFFYPPCNGPDGESSSKAQLLTPGNSRLLRTALLPPFRKHNPSIGRAQAAFQSLVLALTRSREEIALSRNKKHLLKISTLQPWPIAGFSRTVTGIQTSQLRVSSPAQED